MTMALQAGGDALHGQAAKLALVLALSFLVGFEREEHSRQRPRGRSVAYARTR